MDRSNRFTPVHVSDREAARSDTDLVDIIRTRSPSTPQMYWFH